MKKLSSLIAALAYVTTVISVNNTCTFILHQEKLPGVAKKLRKF